LILKQFEFLTKEAHNRETFFRQISYTYPSLDKRYQLIESAYDDAKDAFRSIKRQGGERYFEHIRAVVLIIILYLKITDYRIIIAALLHDIVEDIPSWTIERVQKKYGIEIALLVQYATKPSKEFPDPVECLEVYHRRFEQAPHDFFYIKMPDRLHNVMTLDYCSLEKRLRKIKETIEHYLPYAQKHGILFHELTEALALVAK
jgi:GTP pyrophosphokinase